MNNKITKLLLTLACILPFSAYANYSISPIKLNFIPGDNTTSLTLKNEGEKAKKFQVAVYEVVKKNGKQTNKKSKDLTPTPASFKIAPGHSQLIRVVLKNDNLNASNKDYKLSVKELPEPQNKESGNVVNLVLDFRVPITINK